MFHNIRSFYNTIWYWWKKKILIHKKRATICHPVCSHIKPYCPSISPDSMERMWWNIHCCICSIYVHFLHFSHFFPTFLKCFFASFPKYELQWYLNKKKAFKWTVTLSNFFSHSIGNFCYRIQLVIFVSTDMNLVTKCFIFNLTTIKHNDSVTRGWVHWWNLMVKIKKKKTEFMIKFKESKI